MGLPASPDPGRGHPELRDKKTRLPGSAAKIFKKSLGTNDTGSLQDAVGREQWQSHQHQRTCVVSTAGLQVNLLFLRLICKGNSCDFLSNLPGPEPPPGLET